MDCEAKTTKKYVERNGPPYGANEEGCRGEQMLGNDGCLYESQPNAKGIYTWKKLMCAVSPVKKTAVKKNSKKAAVAEEVSEEVHSSEAHDDADGEPNELFDSMVAAKVKPRKSVKKAVKKTTKKVTKKAAGKKAVSVVKSKASPAASPSKASPSKSPAGRKKAALPKKAKSAVKRALSAYMFFSAESQKKYEKSVPIAQRGAEIGAAWRAMTAAQKKPYEAMAAKDKARAERERANLAK
jgi:hypothetical protein